MDDATVWIEDGCIACRSCEYEVGEVFRIDDGLRTSTVLGSAREDGRTDPNRAARSRLRPELAERLAPRLQNAADGCPVSVIRYHRGPIHLSGRVPSLS